MRKFIDIITEHADDKVKLTIDVGLIYRKQLRRLLMQSPEYFSFQEDKSLLDSRFVIRAERRFMDVLVNTLHRHFGEDFDDVYYAYLQRSQTTPNFDSLEL